jgi:hypothetical protein
LHWIFGVLFRFLKLSEDLWSFLKISEAFWRSLKLFEDL